MKRCPTCSRVYADEGLRFCLDDGAALVSHVMSAGAQPTLRINPTPTRKANVTEVLPGSRVTPERQGQNIVPWLVAGGALLLVVLMGLGITIVLLVDRRPSTSTTQTNTERTKPTATPTPRQQNGVVDLTGTKWTNDSPVSQIKEFTFNADGTINSDKTDTWRQNGNILIVSMTNGYAIYEGAITGDRIEYKAHNKVDLKWTGTLTRVR